MLRRVVEHRVFRSITAPVAGRLAFELLRGRVDRLQDVTIHSARLRRIGARRGKRLVAPTYEARLVVELVGQAADLEAAAMRRPYRGVSQGDFDSLVVEVGARQATIESASATFLARSLRQSLLADALEDLRSQALVLGLALAAGVYARNSPLLDDFELPGRATGSPPGIADFAGHLQRIGVDGGWSLRTRWFE